MTTYGQARYGPPNLYGDQRPVYTVPAGNIALPLISNAYLIDPFRAVATDYTTITLTWKLPDPTTATPMTEFRLITNRYGYPVDQNDGNIVVDVTSVQEFGNTYTDINVVPGTFHYYAIYINTGSSWVRSGFTACLMPASHGYADRLFSLLPEYLRDITDTELTQVPDASQVIAPQVPASGVTVANPYTFPVQITLTGGTITDLIVDGVDLGVNTPVFWMAGSGNVTVYYSAVPQWTWLNIPAGGANGFLQQFLAVAGWSLDYLKTQYDFTLDSLNDPMQMPLSDLVQLCTELGLPFSPEIPAYFMRKAAANWAVIMQQRGSVEGIAEHASVLSGYELDLQTSQNLLLENDQSAPLHPRYSWWSPSITYLTGERVMWGPVTSVPPEWSPNRTYVANVSVLYNGLLYKSAMAVPANVPPPTSNTYWTLLTGPYVYQALSNNINTAPSGSVSGTATWTLIDNLDSYGSAAPIALAGRNAPSTWEALYPNEGATYVTPTYSLVESFGLPNPLAYSYDWTHNGFRAYNLSGSSSQPMWLRSVLRQASDVSSSNTNLTPDPQLVIEHGIPVPQQGQAWNATTRYTPGEVVSYSGGNYLAQRASTGAVPPSPGVPLNANWDFETGQFPWNALNGATIVQSSTYALHGTYSLKSTPNGTSSFPGPISEQVPVIPLANYQVTANVFIPGGYSTAQATIFWYDAFGTYLGQAASTGVVVPSSVWTPIPVAAQAPANAAFGQIVPFLNGTPASSVVSYWDVVAISCVSTPEWTPLGLDVAVPVMVSGQFAQSNQQSSSLGVTVTPFVEWYDNWGNFISRVFARTTTPGTAGIPNNYAFDSFGTGAETSLNGRELDTQNRTWSATGTWTLDGNGNAYASGTSNALIQAPLSCTQAVTFTQPPPSGLDTGLVFWYTSASSFWHAGTHALWYWNGTTWTQTAYTGSATFSPGDRIYVVTNQAASPYIKVYKNFVSTAGLIASVTSATGVPASNATVFSGIALEVV